MCSSHMTYYSFRGGEFLHGFSGKKWYRTGRGYRGERRNAASISRKTLVRNPSRHASLTIGGPLLNDGGRVSQLPAFLFPGIYYALRRSGFHPWHGGSRLLLPNDARELEAYQKRMKGFTPRQRRLEFQMKDGASGDEYLFRLDSTGFRPPGR
jgi:hypothetical protein